jgi:hypothetical protein
MLFPKLLSCPRLLVLESLLVASAPLPTFATAPVAMAQDEVIKKAPAGQSDPSSGKTLQVN